MYMGNDDAPLIAWLKKTLAEWAEREPARARGILAFAALLGREGSTASLNTYDNQIITWGVGFGARAGLMPAVMERLEREGPRAVGYLRRAGFRYLGGQEWEVFDSAGKLVRGRDAALKAARDVPEVMAALVHVARDPDTRDGVLRAQLETFLAHAGNVDGIGEAATQALVNFQAHLRHWAPGYANGALAWAAAQVPGAPHPSRDVRLAELVTKRFYDKAAGQKWVPAWSQFKLYLQHMVKDGLVELDGHPLLGASSPPTGNA
jgi:hypothetical protein